MWEKKIDHIRSKYKTSDVNFWKAWNDFDGNIVDKEPFLKNSELWENHYNKLYDKPDIPCHLSNDSKIISDFAKSKRKVEYDSCCL